MGYFEGLSSSSFKKDADGRTVFYPIGVLGKGRVLPDQPTEERIRAFLTRYYMVSLSLVIVFVAFVHWIWAVALLPVLWLWFYFGTRPLVAGLPYSASKLTLKESFANSGTAHGKGVLWSLFVCSMLFVLGGVLILSRSQNTEDALIGFSSIAFFGLCSCAIGYMLWARRA
jgi:hypothetical protein